MLLTKKSSAWLLAALQAVFSFFFLHALTRSFSIGLFDIFDGASSVQALSFVLIGLASLLVLAALWKFEITLIVLLFALHLVCPLIFFTALTRNPYFTQIVLLNIWIAFIGMVWVWECWQSKKIIFPKTVLNVPLLIFLFLAGLSLISSFYTHDASFYPSIFSEGGKASIFLVLNCWMVFYIGAMVEEKWRIRFIGAAFAVGAVAGLYGLMQYYGLERIWQRNINPFGNRPLSTFGNPNFLSSYLLLLTPLAFIQFLNAKKRGASFLWMLLFTLFLSGILATMTRSTWVGLLGAILLLFLVSSSRFFLQRNVKKCFLLLGVCVLCVVFWPKSNLGSYSKPWDRVKEIEEVKNPQGYAPWHQRVLIWSASLLMVKDHPFIGKGWGLFELFYPYYQGRLLFSPLLRNFRTHANNAHNEIFEMWSQVGFLGLGVMVWVWVLIILFGFHLAREPSPLGKEKRVFAWALSTGAVAMLVDNLFGNVSLHFAIPAFLFWWLLGTLFGLEEPRRSVVIPIGPKEKIILGGFFLFLAATVYWNFCREFQEIYYFKGYSISRDIKQQDNARKHLETAWSWYPREVNCNYELANTYARLSQTLQSLGLEAESQREAKKAVWAYIQANDANCGYDEIYFNLAASLAQLNIIQESQQIDGVLKGQDIFGAEFYYSRALLINPFLKDGYQFLGNIYLKDIAQHKEQAIQLYRQARYFFPEDKEFVEKLNFAMQYKG